MIHHDYLLRLIEEFARALSRIQDFRLKNRAEDARHALDQQLQQITGADRESILRLSTTEILARLLRSGTTHEVHTRAYFLVALLKESGDVALAEGHEETARETHFKALRLLFSVFEHDDPCESPAFVPTVEALRSTLATDSIPPDLLAHLMLHFERSGCYADAENTLFSLLDACGPTPELLELGTDFYERLLALNDASLERGHLPRSEAADGLAEFQRSASA